MEYSNVSSDRVSLSAPHPLLFALTLELRQLRADMETPATPKPLAAPVRKMTTHDLRSRKAVTTPVSAFN